MIERPVPQRFKIEDIAVQDYSGVIFRAVDSMTGATVAVRRFFPFGPNGGGLTQDEQDEYARTLQLLQTVDYPSLRSIVSGGCDPVDGIPFLTTEWVEGTSLRKILTERSLSRTEATALLIHALKACEKLSAVLGREGIWIETDPDNIIIGPDQSDRSVTFWISPLRWFGQLPGQQGMAPMVALAEAALDWSGETPANHVADGLTEWLEWLRHADEHTSLNEARKLLAATVHATTATGPVTHRPARQSTVTATPDATKRKKSNSSVLPWLFGGMTLIAIGLMGWLLLGNRPDLQTTAAAVGSRLEALRDSLPIGKSKAEPHAAPAEGSEVLTLQDRDILLTRKGTPVVFEATLLNTRFSDSGSTFYLEFSPEHPKSGPLGVVTKQNLTGELTPEFFKPLIGNKIRIKGVARNHNNRPEIEITNPSDVEAVP